MVVGLIILTYKLTLVEDEVSKLETVILKKDYEIADLNANIMASRTADKEVLKIVEYKDKVIEKKVVEIQKVYVPQIEYIDRYVGDVNASNCDNGNSLLNTVIY